MAIDVAEARERDRRRRLRRVLFVLGPIGAWLWWRIISGNPVSPGMPDFGPNAILWLPGLALILILGLVIVLPMLGNGRSPHTIYLPEQIEIGFDDVRGLGGVLDEVRHTLDVFLNHARFRAEMGGNPRRGVLFEGPPGTGKTHIAKAMAREAGVPFLYVSSTAFQSMWYGATSRKIRTFFRALRKVARRDGGAIGFIEEIDAIGGKRGNVDAATAEPNTAQARVERSAMAQGTGGVVNELLIQMQSFDEPTRPERVRNVLVRFANRFLPAHRQLRTIRPGFSNILLIGATNRVDSLDPALLRPGRFDRILHFGLPGRRDRRELVDYFLATKVHTAALDEDAERDRLAAATMGYTPASLERLFDEALLVALRADRGALTPADLKQAQMEVEIGLPHPVDYTDEERTTIAVHESGHAVMAYLVANRRLELLSIVKRRDALGLLAHRDEEERFTRRASEMRAMVQISFGGMVAEELFFGEAGTGPASDLAAATQVAADMVGSYGMGDSLVSLQAVDRGVFQDNMVSKVVGDARARKTLERILTEARRETARLLADHRYLVVALRDALLEREELYEQEIMEILRDAETRALKDDKVLIDLRSQEARIIERPARFELIESPEGD
ncbi:MAG: AAA family ATPase [Acidimicrobiia bacterium]|jgi:ATP-dependent Zn protease